MKFVKMNLIEKQSVITSDRSVSEPMFLTNQILVIGIRKYLCLSFEFAFIHAVYAWYYKCPPQTNIRVWTTNRVSSLAWSNKMSCIPSRLFQNSLMYIKQQDLHKMYFVVQKAHPNKSESWNVHM